MPRRAHERQRLVIGAFIVPLVWLATSTACATSSEPYAVSVRNDLPQTVTLAVCDSQDCSRVIDRQLLEPGQAGAVNVEINGGYGPAILLGTGTAVIGCMPFRFSKRPSAEVTVRASEAVACGSSGGTQAAHGKDWPNPDL
jgi:hypothetical protein